MVACVRSLAHGAFLLAVLCGQAAFAADAVDVAMDQINKPYQWGASGPSSFDCSGLTQYVFSQVGVQIPRRAIDQSTEGELVTGPLQRGDLLFFSTDDAHPGTVTHVGIYVGDNIMIDASSHAEAIKGEDITGSYWTSRFLFARRVAADTLESEGQNGLKANWEHPQESRNGVDTQDGSRLGAPFTLLSTASRCAPSLNPLCGSFLGAGACVWPGDAPRIFALAQFAGLMKVSQGESEYEEAQSNLDRPLDVDRRGSDTTKVNQRDGPLPLLTDVSHAGSHASGSGPGTRQTRDPSTWPDL